MYGNQFYNMLYREDERELIPICKQMGVSLMPYSPLAAGHLTRPTWEADTLRARTDRVARGKYDRMEQEDIEIHRACHYDDVRRLHGVQNFAHVVVQGALSAVVAAVVAGTRRTADQSCRPCGGCRIRSELFSSLCLLIKTHTLFYLPCKSPDQDFLQIQYRT